MIVEHLENTGKDKKNQKKELIHNPTTDALIVLVWPISFFEVCIFVGWDQLLPAFYIVLDF